MPFDIYRTYQNPNSAQSWHFRRHWQESHFTAAELDRLSDHELANGHVQRAEMLAWKAASMREEARS